MGRKFIVADYTVRYFLLFSLLFFITRAMSVSVVRNPQAGDVFVYRNQSYIEFRYTGT